MCDRLDQRTQEHRESAQEETKIVAGGGEERPARPTELVHAGVAPDHNGDALGNPEIALIMPTTAWPENRGSTGNPRHAA
jgi:hypothetical protein